MSERFMFPESKEAQYTNDELKELILRALAMEVEAKEKKLGRPLSTEEKKEIRLTEAFINRYHAQGILPAASTFEGHFGSIIHLAHLLGLSSSRKQREYYYASEKGEFIKALRSFVKEFQEKNGRMPTRTDIFQTVRRGEIPNMPTNIFKHMNVFEILEIPRGKGER